MEFANLDELLRRKITQTPNPIALPQCALDNFVAACERSTASSAAAFQRARRWLVPGGAISTTIIPVNEAPREGMLGIVIHPTGEATYAVTFPVTFVAVLFNLFNLLGPFPVEVQKNYRPFTIGDLVTGGHPWMRCRQASVAYWNSTRRARRKTLLGAITGRHQTQRSRLSALEPLAAKVNHDCEEVCQWMQSSLMFVIAHETGHAMLRHWSFDLSDGERASMTPEDFERCCELETDQGAINALIIENVLPHSGTRLRALIDEVASEFFGRPLRGLSDQETTRLLDALSPPLFHYMDLARTRFKNTGSLDDDMAVSAGALRALMGAVLPISLQWFAESVDTKRSASLLGPPYRYHLAAHYVAPERDVRSAFMSEFCGWCDGAAERYDLADLRILPGLSFNSEILLGTREDLRLKAVFRHFAKLRPDHHKPS